MNRSYILVALLLSACANPDEPERPEEIGVAENEIHFGTLVTDNVAPYNSVVRFEAGGFGCTATKISASRFLTAAHCAIDMNLAVGTNVFISNTLSGLSGVNTPVTFVAVHPAYKQSADHSRAPDAAVFDVAADKVAGIPALAPGFYKYQGTGSTAQLVGYGVDTESLNDYKKQRTTLTALSLQAYLDMRGANFPPEYGRAEYVTNTLTTGTGGGGGARSGDHTG